MKVIRRASSNWKGSGKEGRGTVTTQSKVLNGTPYSFGSRFGEDPETNPEELIGAAHAGCFAMKLSIVLTQMGFVPDNLDVSEKVIFEDGRITTIELNLVGKVPGISAEQFEEAAVNAKENCPISLLFNADIQMTASLA